MNKIFFAGCALAVLGAGFHTHAADIVSLNLTGNLGNDSFENRTDLTLVLATGWTQSLNFNNVTVSAPFGVGGEPGSGGEAFLTTSIGPGTSVANEVASTTFVMPQVVGEPYPNVTLFTGLTLPAGTYYLTVTATPGYTGGWESGNTDFSSDDPHASLLGFFGFQSRAVYDPPPADYAPANEFYTRPTEDQIFSVTGDVVPEPSTLALFSIGLALLTRRHRESRISAE